MLIIYSSITVQARLGVLLRTIKALLSSPNTHLPQCRPPSLKEQRFEIEGRLCVSSQNGSKVARGTIVVTTVDEYTLKSTNHIVVDDERVCWPWRRQKREFSRLQIARRSAGLPSSSLPSVLRSIAFPNNWSPLTSYNIEPPSTA